MGKFDYHVDKGVLVCYSSTRKAYKCYNIRLKKVLENINVTVDKNRWMKIKGRRKRINGTSLQRRSKG
jgi:hypothetical protein